jgi:HPt (histidine-containing phosphotransfer) domain-containing protein
MNPDDCIDATALDRLRHLGEDKLVKEMIELYLDYAPKMLRNALAGEQAGDCLPIEKAAHSLKSSAGNIGAHGVRELAARIESLARDKQLDAVSPLLRELEAASETVRRRLETLRPT